MVVEAELEDVGLPTDADGDDDEVAVWEGDRPLLVVWDKEPFPERVKDPVEELLYEPVLEPELVAVLLEELLEVSDKDDDDEPLLVAEAVQEAVAEVREDREDDELGAWEGDCVLLADCDEEPLPERVDVPVEELLCEPVLELELVAVLLATLLADMDAEDDDELLLVAEAVGEAEAEG